MAATIEEKLPHAMKEIFTTAAGAVLHAYLTKRIESFSAVSEDLITLLPERSSDIHEGRRVEAKTLRDAPKELEAEKNG